METDVAESREDWGQGISRYARRLARLCLLKQRCGEDHQVLRTEINLMDMARSKLQASILRKVDVDAFRDLRPDIEFLVRQEAKDSVRLWAEDRRTADEVRTAIDKEPLDSLFLLDC